MSVCFRVHSGPFEDEITLDDARATVSTSNYDNKLRKKSIIFMKFLASRCHAPGPSLIARGRRELPQVVVVGVAVAQHVLLEIIGTPWAKRAVASTVTMLVNGH